MIKVIITLLLFLATTTVFAQSSWKEMNAFHDVAANAFHSAEGGKLKPARDSAAVVLAAAERWQGSAMPVGYNAAVMKPLLEKLVMECAAITNAIATKQKDKPLKVIVSKAHDTFHEIVNEGEVKKRMSNNLIVEVL